MDRKSRGNSRDLRKNSDANHLEEGSKRTSSVIYSLLNEKKRSQGTCRIGPSAVLLEAKKFLPLLKEANSKLQEELKIFPSDPEKFNIEHVNENQQHIEMDLAFFSESDSDSEISSSGPGGCSVDDTVLLSEQHVEGSSSLGKCHLIQEIDTAK